MSKFPHLKIRRAGPPDAAAVRSLTRDAYAQWIPVIGREPLPMRADYEKAVREHEIDLLYAGEQLVALIEIIPSVDHLFIENIAVSPEHQGKGLGRHLLRHAEAKATSVGLGELRLLTNQAFATNVQLYQSVGFRIDRTELFPNGSTAVFMSKQLTRDEYLDCSMKTYSFEDFSKTPGAVLEEALKAPVVLTKRGKEKLVIVPADYFRRLTGQAHAAAYSLHDLPDEIGGQLDEGLEMILGKDRSEVG